MKLVAAKIKNFRSIKDCTIFFGNIRAIVGEKNSGKTAILRALNSFFNYDEEKLSCYPSFFAPLINRIATQTLRLTAGKPCCNRF